MSSLSAADHSGARHRGARATVRSATGACVIRLRRRRISGPMMWNCALESVPSTTSRTGLIVACGDCLRQEGGRESDTAGVMPAGRMPRPAEAGGSGYLHSLVRKPLGARSHGLMRGQRRSPMKAFLAHDHRAARTTSRDWFKSGRDRIRLPDPSSPDAPGQDTRRSFF